MGKNIPIEAFTEPTMKIFLLFVTCLFAKETLGQAKTNAQAKISVDQRAPSTFENCNCQCNSDTWTDGQYIRGNCRSKDRNGALFCYVSGSALCSCRDVQVSSFLKNNQGRFTPSFAQESPPAPPSSPDCLWCLQVCSRGHLFRPCAWPPLPRPRSPQSLPPPPP